MYSKPMRMSVLFSVLAALAGCGAPSEDVSEQGVDSSLQAVNQELGAWGRHCVTQAVAIERGNPLPEKASPASLDCFASFAEAISFATNGKTRLPSTAKPADLMQEALPTMGTSAVYVIGVEYTDADFIGASLTFTSSSTCEPHDYAYWSMPFGWDNVISSAKAFSGCNHAKHYENTNHTGAMVDCGTQCNYVGAAMNDQTSSIWWSK